MNIDFTPDVDSDDLAREKSKARALRNTQWWKNKRASGGCHYCGKDLPARELTMDHVIPLIRGGKSVKSNLVPCCKTCNSNKKYLLPTEWVEYLERLRTSGIAT